VLWHCSKDTEYSSSCWFGSTADGTVLEGTDHSETFTCLDHSWESKSRHSSAAHPGLPQYHRGTAGELWPLLCLNSQKRWVSHQMTPPLAPARKHLETISITWCFFKIASFELSVFWTTKWNFQSKYVLQFYLWVSSVQFSWLLVLLKCCWHFCYGVKTCWKSCLILFLSLIIFMNSCS